MIAVRVLLSLKYSTPNSNLTPLSLIFSSSFSFFFFFLFFLFCFLWWGSCYSNADEEQQLQKVSQEFLKNIGAASASENIENAFFYRDSYGRLFFFFRCEVGFFAI